MDNLIAEGKAKPFIIVMANSYVPGAAARVADRVPRRPADRTPLRAADAVPVDVAALTSAHSNGFSSTT